MKTGLLRGVPWPSLLTATGGGGALLGAAVSAPRSWLGARLIGLAFALLAAAAALTVDEAAAAVVDATPYSLRLRTVIRTTALLLPLTVSATALGTMRLRDSSTPFWGLCLQLVSVAVVALAASAAARRRHPTPGELVGSTVTLLVVALSLFDPLARWFPLLPLTADQHAGRSQAAWSVAITASMLVLARASRDPLDT